MHRIPFKKSDNPTLNYAYQRYVAQIAGCYYRKDRNGKPIEMRLTFEEWWKIWQDSGKWELRGKNGDDYCMARHNDLGHYELGNVEIITKAENTARYNARVRKRKQITVQMRLRLPKPKPIIRCPHCSGILS